MRLPSIVLPPLGSMAEPVPHARLLGNGRYVALVTGAGTGFASCAGQQLTAWSGDRVEDDGGMLVYVRDLDSSAVWSLGTAPLGATGHYEATYEPGMLRIARHDHGIDAACAVCVAPDADAELRQLRLHNASSERRRLEVTTYAAVVLHEPAAHASHPAFSKLFVETDVDAATGVLLARRRPRGPAGAPLYLAHALCGPGSVSWETDRVRFIGRGRSLTDPLALVDDGALAGTTGSVLDPVLALRRRFEIDPGATVCLALVLCCAPEAAAARALALRWAEPGAAAATLASARERARRLLAEHGLGEAQGEYLHELAGAICYGDPALRAPEEVLRRARGGIPDLWALGLRSDRPLVVLEADDRAGAAQADELARAVAYWAAHGLAVQALVIRGEGCPDELLPGARPPLAVVERAAIEPRRLDAVRALARLVLGSRWPRPERARRPPAPACVASVVAPCGVPVHGAEGRRFYNGYGGFAEDGRAYVIDVPGAAGARPPLPWINVLANPEFGAIVSESGAGCTWSRNSREHRLTPWSNDPLLDPHGEALYVRCAETGAFWSPQPGPAGAGGAYRVTHGFGVSSWRHERDGLEQSVDTFVAAGDPVRITRVRIENRCSHPRPLDVVAMQRLVLGVLPEEVAHAVVTDRDQASGALVARSGLREAFAGGVVFAAAHGPAGATASWSGDRAAFVGRGRSMARPAALASTERLDGRLGARLDPCFAQQLRFEVPPGETAECVLLLGEGADEAAVRALVARYATPAGAAAALAAVEAGWERTLGAIAVETPSPAVDAMVNGWLLYQTLACRIWGRTALYQSGGAFGYRDQLQDAAALVWARPDLTRAQILRHAAHQFVEGDAMHWWHPPTDRGTRTRFADDLLWLPWVTAGYVAATGDHAVLDEQVPFVAARLLEPGEHETMVEARTTRETASLYEHCCRAIDRSLTRGAHGLPLMGTGDWNDGMNLVGAGGRGESVWMGFFLHVVLGDFLPLCERRGDAAGAARYRAYRAALPAALEAAWDGGWYRRAYFDDGTPLGTATATECRIDVLPQAWAVMSGAVDRARAAVAIDAVERELVLDPPGMIRLLAPPFDRMAHEPGYIKGYVPGIRENGGQYTHAAAWAVRASAELGRRDRAAAWLAMLSPAAHAASPEAVAVYQVEPYVVAADLYSAPAHRGRGGWTWYTGSAGWLFRVAVESVLGLRLEAGRWLHVRPRVPDVWPGFRVRYRLPDGRTCYEVAVENPARDATAVVAATLDGAPCEVTGDGARIPLAADGGVHQVSVRLGAASASPAASNQ